jgi:DNA-binding response OmpR family regulator
VKFTAQGEVRLAVRVEAGRVITTVSDTGLGIPLAEQSAIFAEFRQSERTTARGYGGLGLGLAICKRLVELHAGEIAVQSSGTEGEGSTFYFSLPILLNQTQSASERMSTLVVQQQTVLVLAEKALDGRRLREHLTRQGFQVEESLVGETSHWLPQVLAAPPGAIILEGQLASERGWEILKELKANSETQDVPVLFYALARDQATGSMLQFDYLTKPVGKTELAQALAHLEASSPESEKEKIILIVDDHPGILEMHARIIQAQSPAYRVIQAQNGREALALIQHQLPDLVLLDLMMPELDGFAVLEAMQAEEMTRAIPVIVLTAQLLMETDMARLNRGVATVLKKGMFSTEETLAHIEAVLARNRKLGNEAQFLARKAMAYLHEHYAEEISRENIARHVGVSEDYLTRCFHQETGVTLTVYLNRYRVKQAKELLASGRTKITEVALAVGFSNSKYFDRVFRQEIGMSPKEYRQHGGR